MWLLLVQLAAADIPPHPVDTAQPADPSTNQGLEPAPIVPPPPDKGCFAASASLLALGLGLGLSRRTPAPQPAPAS